MNLILAILSFFGATFLPGAIAQRIFVKERLVISSFVVYSFVLSLCFNFVLISLLIIARIYTQNVVVAVLLLEWIVFFIMFRNEIMHGIPPLTIGSTNANVLNLALILGTLISLYMLNKVLKVDIFYAWDAVVSWNRWASELASMKFVLNEGGYPQLYPMLLSLGYVASGKVSSFQGIGVAIWHYFAFIGIVCSVFLAPKDSTQKVKWSIFGLILAIIAYISFFSLSDQFFIGYADMPVAMMILVSSLFVLKANICLDEGDRKSACKYLIFGALSAGIAVEIKQAGLFCVAVYAMCLCYLGAKYKLERKIVLLCMLIAIAFAAPWIIIAMYKKFILLTDATNASYTMSRIYGDKTPIQRLINNIYNPFSLFALCSIFAIAQKQKIIGIFGAFGFAYFIFWGCFLSYDLRNMQGGIPLMIIATSYLLYLLFSKKSSIFLLLHKRVAMIFVAFVVVGIGIGYFSQEKILAGEYKKKSTLGGKEISEIVRDTYDNRGVKLLLTGNQPIAYNPNIDRSYYRLYSFNATNKNLALDLERFKSENGTLYILLTKDEFEAHKDFFRDSMRLGEAGYYILLEF